MASILRSVGLFSARRRWLVVAVWLVLLVGSGVAAGTLSGPTSNSFSIPGSQSTEALATVKEKFGISPDGAPVRLVFQAPRGTQVTDPAVARSIVTTVRALGTVPGMETVTNPLDPKTPAVSPDRTVALVNATFAESEGNIDAAALERVTQIADQARASGAQVKVGGAAFQEVPQVLGPGEVVGVVVAFVVLLLTYGALGAAGANLLTALVGVGLGAAGVTALTGFVDLQSTTPILAVMLGLAVGIDYALFIFARFRAELRAGHPIKDAVGVATGTAGSAVVVAGTTVVIALAGLSIVGIPFLAQMGLAAAATVVIAVLVAITLVPAILALLGTRVLRPKERVAYRAGELSDEAAEQALHKKGFLRSWRHATTDHPVISLIAALVVTGLLAAPVLSMRTALPDDGIKSPQTEARQAYDIVAKKFAPGLNGPLVLLVEGQNVRASAPAAARQLAQTPGVLAITPPVPSRDGSAVMLTVIPATGPHDEATSDLVKRIRNTDYSGATVKVTGVTAVAIDVNLTLANALPKYLALVVGLSLLLLLLVFRSILVPLTATIGFLLSYGAALGATTAVYQFGWLGGLFGVDQTAPLMSLLPIIVVGILFGLSMDYQVFMVSRMHEAYAHGADPKEAVLEGFRRSAPVVIAAATIMAAVFGGFIASHEPMVRSIAFALTVGVLVDAFLVRMLLIPATLRLLGRAAWWLPRGLDKVLPNVDVEGASIEKSARETG